MDGDGDNFRQRLIFRILWLLWEWMNPHHSLSCSQWGMVKVLVDGNL